MGAIDDNISGVFHQHRGKTVLSAVSELINTG